MKLFGEAATPAMMTLLNVSGKVDNMFTDLIDEGDQSPEIMELPDDDDSLSDVFSSSPQEDRVDPGFVDDDYVDDNDMLTTHHRKERCHSLRSQRETIRRSSSEKKIVRFADTLGLDLESVRYITDMDGPWIPKYHPVDRHRFVKRIMEDQTRHSYKSSADSVRFHFRFTQPGSEPGFLQRVRRDHVVLESCCAGRKCVSGTIRVSNLSFEKRVTVRYTCNNWLTHSHVGASYIMYSGDGCMDRFTFAFNVPDYFGAGCRLEFAIQYVAEGQEVWDNNYGNNYLIEG